MKILVGIKHVPDTETKIKIGADGRSIDRTGIKWVMSPFDEYALEQALLLKEAGKAEEVIVVCAAGEGAQTTLRQGLAMGADRGVLIGHPGFEGGDALVRATALAAVAREEGVGLVLTGKYGVGSDEWQTGPMLAELLGWGHATALDSLEIREGSFVAERGVEGAVEVIEGKLPAVLTCEKGLNEPRYASLKGIMQAKKKPVATKTPADLGIEATALEQPMLVVESLELPPERAGDVKIGGSPEEIAEKLVRALREEAKVI